MPGTSMAQGGTECPSFGAFQREDEAVFGEKAPEEGTVPMNMIYVTLGYAGSYGYCTYVIVGQTIRCAY